MPSPYIPLPVDCYLKGRVMPRCPSCGDEMRFDKKIMRYVCKGCGLTVSRYELDLMKEKMFEEKEVDITEEYYRWWINREKRK